MPQASPAKKRLRLIAALMALCYGWLAGVASFQHEEASHHDIEALLCASTASVRTAGPLPIHCRLAANTAPLKATSCPTCAWQAANLSPALPAFVFLSPPCAVPSILAALPRYGHPTLIHRSSRAPPLA